MIPQAVLVGTGGAVGATLRYLLDRSVPATRWPLSTLTVNVLGSFVLGVVTFSGFGAELGLFVGVGVCGAFTTYSSFSLQTLSLWRDGRRPLASLYALGTLALCLGAVGLAAALVSPGGP